MLTFETFEQWDRFARLHTTLNEFIHVPVTLSTPSPTAPDHALDEDSSTSHQKQSESNKLPLLQLADWKRKGHIIKSSELYSLFYQVESYSQRQGSVE